MLKFISEVLARRRFTKDLETTFVRTFDRLLAASRKEELIERLTEVAIALGSCMGALRDVYPGAIVEDESLALAFLEANAGGPLDDRDALLEAILQLVRECPRTLNDQMGVVSWLIAPKAAQRARDQGLI